MERLTLNLLLELSKRLRESDGTWSDQQIIEFWASDFEIELERGFHLPHGLPNPY